jgi:hypothetical protein
MYIKDSNYSLNYTQQIKGSHLQIKLIIYIVY